MADLITFTDESTTEYSYMFQYAISPDENPDNPSNGVVVGWNPNRIDGFINERNYMDLFIPEFVYYNGFRIYIKGIYDGAFNGEEDNLGDVILKQFNRSHIRTLHLPEGIEYIGDAAFLYCHNLSYVNFPDTLRQLGDRAFALCEALQTKDYDGITDSQNPGYLHIPWTVESISSAFYGCSSLTVIEIGSAGNGSNLNTNIAFSFPECSNLKTFRWFVKNLEVSIPNYCFQNCTNLTAVEIPLGFIKSIGDRAFYGCQNLNNITQSEPVLNINTGAIIYDHTGVTIGTEAFKNCMFLIRFPLQADIISLGASAFEGCQYLQEINLGSSLTEIPERSFKLCATLDAITIPKDCARIGANAFNACTRLRDIFIPSTTLESIGSGAFLGCINLQRLWLMATNYNDIIYSGSPFGDYTVNPNKSLILNSSLTQNWDESNFEAYETAFNTYWKVSPTKESILFTPTINNPDELTFILELNRPAFNSTTGTATVVGITNQSAITTSIIDLPSSVSSNGRTYTINKIGDDTFAYNYRISKINIPSTITEIGNRAFENCYNLQEISGPAAGNFPVTKIGNGAFAHCRKLSKINYTDNKLHNLQYLGKDAFIGCNSLGKINLGTNYNGPIPERAFAHCGNLQVSKKSSTSYITQPTSTRYDNTTFFATTPTFVNI